MEDGAVRADWRAIDVVDDAWANDALPDDGQLTACPNDCSFHGTCIHETCHCDVGYASDDCSYPLMAFVDFGIRSIDPPSGLALGGTRVFLTGFNLVAGMPHAAASLWWPGSCPVFATYWLPRVFCRFRPRCPASGMKNPTHCHTRQAPGQGGHS